MDKWHAGVLVGVDGSEAARRALDWAATVAARHGARLTVISAHEVPSSVGDLGFSPAQPQIDAEHAVEQALEQLARTHPAALDVGGEVVQGRAAHVLVRRSRTSDLVVVGRRGLSGADRVVLGSVSSAVAAMAHSPVAVVPEHAPGGAPRRVVAAVDTSHPDIVLDYAFREAAASARPLEIVHVVDAGVLAGSLPEYPGTGDGWHEWAGRVVREEARRWADKHPEVPYEVTITEGRRSAVLLHHLQGDDLLVVGGRRHPSVVGRVLGSVPDRLLRSAPCPVVVAHLPERKAG